MTTIEQRVRSLRHSSDARRFQVVGICKDEKSYVPLGQYDNLWVLHQDSIREAANKGEILKIKNHKDMTLSAVFFSTSLLKDYALMKELEALLEKNDFDAESMNVHMYKFEK